MYKMIFLMICLGLSQFAFAQSNAGCVTDGRVLKALPGFQLVDVGNNTTMCKQIGGSYAWGLTCNCSGDCQSSNCVRTKYPNGGETCTGSCIESGSGNTLSCYFHGSQP